MSPEAGARWEFPNCQALPGLSRRSRPAFARPSLLLLASLNSAWLIPSYPLLLPAPPARPSSCHASGLAPRAPAHIPAHRSSPQLVPAHPDPQAWGWARVEELGTAESRWEQGGAEEWLGPHGNASLLG